MATGRIGVTPTLGTRWSKAPSAGTTSLSGLDDNSVSLVYSVGYEAVYRNGVLLSRGNDYTATDGTTVTLIDATLTGDIIEIFANETIPLSDTYSQTVSDGKFINNTLTTTTGDIIYASAANTPARLAIGSSAEVLTVSGGIPAWAAPATGGGMTLLASSTQAGTVSTFDFTSISGSYQHLQLIVRGYYAAVDNRELYIRFNSVTGSNYYYATGTSSGAVAWGNSFIALGDGTDSGNTNSNHCYTIWDYANTSTWKMMDGIQVVADPTTPTNLRYKMTKGFWDGTSAISTITITNNSSNITGSFFLYGIK